ncbi:MAG: low molecular weight phosphatase family protein [Pseudonocardiaceae bacterium]
MTTATRRGLPGLGELEIEHGLRAISHDLTKKFAGRLSPETVDRFVRESFTLMDRKAKIRVHLVALTRRFAWDRLTALEKVQNAVATGVPEVLFVCVHNAGRSQMAAALLAHHGQDRVVVRSAGSAPADEINPAVEEALHEIGVPLTDAYPKPLTDEVVQASDVVITMGCGDACPIYPGKRYLDWELNDPAGQPVDGVRAIRDDIDSRVRELLAELGPARSAQTGSGPGIRPVTI